MLTTVTHNLGSFVGADPDPIPIPNVLVEIELVDSNGVFYNEYQILGKTVTTSDECGHWEVELVPNSQFSTPDALYRVVQTEPGKEPLDPIFFVVPESIASVTLFSCIVRV